MNEQSAKCPRCNGFLDAGIVGSNGYGAVTLCKCREQSPESQQQLVGWTCPECQTNYAPSVVYCNCGDFF